MSDSQSPAPSSTPKPRASARPRAGILRKSKQEREEYARKESERAKEREVVEAKSTPKAQSTRGRGAARGRGRGDLGREVTSGVFGGSAGQRLERRVTESGYSEALDQATGSTSAGPSATQNGREVIDVDGPSAGGKSGRGGKRAAVEKNYDVEPEDEDESARRDIERIWISSDEDEDVVARGKRRRSSKAAKPFGGLRPVRASRNEPEEDEEKVQPRKEQEGRTIEVSSDEMAIDDLDTAKKDPPSSPELSRRLKKTDGRNRESRTLHETIEERKERRRLAEDVEKLHNAFLHKSDTDETVDSKDENVFGRTDHDRMFVFQLPPLVPQLYDPQKWQQPEASQEIDKAIKVEDAAAVESAKKIAIASNTIYSADAKLHDRFPQGFVGKLNIHKSGKVSLDWGGTSMEVRYGTEVDFLQDVVCVEEGDEVDSETDEKLGNAYALGQVEKKMVLVPDWIRLYG